MNPNPNPYSYPPRYGAPRIERACANKIHADNGASRVYPHVDVFKERQHFGGSACGSGQKSLRRRKTRGAIFMNGVVLNCATVRDSPHKLLDLLRFGLDWHLGRHVSLLSEGKPSPDSLPFCGRVHCLVHDCKRLAISIYLVH